MFKISSYDHVGVRVTDRTTAVDFYGKLGFYPEPDEDSPEHSAVGLINDFGVRLNLIYNGRRHPERNVLMDIEEKWPGYTHYAVTVDSLSAVLSWARDNNVPVTEGPMEIGGRRIVCFVRDPDGNVIEFDQLLEKEDVR